MHLVFTYVNLVLCTNSSAIVFRGIITVPLTRWWVIPHLICRIIELFARWVVVQVLNGGVVVLRALCLEPIALGQTYLLTIFIYHRVSMLFTGCFPVTDTTISICSGHVRFRLLYIRSCSDSCSRYRWISNRDRFLRLLWWCFHTCKLHLT